MIFDPEVNVTPRKLVDGQWVDVAGSVTFAYDSTREYFTFNVSINNDYYFDYTYVRVSGNDKYYGDYTSITQEFDYIITELNALEFWENATGKKAARLGSATIQFRCKLKPTLTINCVAVGNGTVSQQQTFMLAPNEEQEFTINAIPNSGYRFVNWKDDNGQVVSLNKSYTTVYTMGQSDTTLTFYGYFEKDYTGLPLRGYDGYILFSTSRYGSILCDA